MTAPSPIHRDPERDGDDYGCFTKRANRRVAAGVRRIEKMLREGDIKDEDSLVECAQDILKNISAEATDTIVKENFFFAIADAIKAAGFDFDPMRIYGW